MKLKIVQGRAKFNSKSYTFALRIGSVGMVATYPNPRLTNIQSSIASDTNLVKKSINSFPTGNSPFSKRV